MFKICFYVPQDHLEQVKNAMFEAGAGNIGDYSCCAWQILGEGQFMPMTNSNPYIGEKNTLEKIKEWKVEMVCAESNIENVIIALHDSHPYEEPAYQVIRIEDL